MPAASPWASFSPRSTCRTGRSTARASFRCSCSRSSCCRFPSSIPPSCPSFGYFSGRAISQGGRDHVSHRLVAVGLSDAVAVLLLWGVSTAAGLIAFVMYKIGFSYAWFGTALLALGFVLFSVVLARVRVYDEDAVPVAAGTDRRPGFRLPSEFRYKRQVLWVLVDASTIVLAIYGSYLLLFGRWPRMGERSRPFRPRDPGGGGDRAGRTPVSGSVPNGLAAFLHALRLVDCGGRHPGARRHFRFPCEQALSQAGAASPSSPPPGRPPWYLSWARGSSSSRLNAALRSGSEPGPEPTLTKDLTH